MNSHQIDNQSSKEALIPSAVFADGSVPDWLVIAALTGLISRWSCVGVTGRSAIIGGAAGQRAPPPCTPRSSAHAGKAIKPRRVDNLSVLYINI